MQSTGYFLVAFDRLLVFLLVAFSTTISLASFEPGKKAVVAVVGRVQPRKTHSRHTSVNHPGHSAFLAYCIRSTSRELCTPITCTHDYTRQRAYKRRDNKVTNEKYCGFKMLTKGAGSVSDADRALGNHRLRSHALLAKMLHEKLTYLP